MENLDRHTLADILEPAPAVARGRSPSCSKATRSAR